MKSNKLAVLSLVVLALVVLSPLAQIGAWKTHDTLLNVYRQASFSTSLSQGNLIPRWGGNLNRGYGHPVLMFHYPLMHYLGHLFHLLGANFIFSLKLTAAFFFVISGLGMYLLLQRYTSKFTAWSLSVIFLLLPYRLVLLFVRGAIAEHSALSLSPWVLLSLDSLLRQKNQRYQVYFSILLAGLILLHQAVSLMVVGLSLALLLSHLLTSTKLFSLRKVTQLLVAFALALGLAGFFWLPAVFEGKYTLRDTLMTASDYLNRYPQPFELIYSPWGFGLGPDKGAASGHSLSLGWPGWLALIISASLLIQKKFTQLKQPLFLTGLAGLLTALFFMLPPSKILVPHIWFFKYFQFPWRFLSLAVLSTPLLLASVTDKFSKPIKSLIVLVAIITSMPTWKIQGVHPNPITDSEFIQTTNLTTDTGEQTPRWATRFQDFPPPADLELVEGGNISYQTLTKQFELHRFTIKAESDSQIADHTLYFPGWTVYVDGQSVPIQFQNPNFRGMITFPVPAGSHQVEVAFENTRLRQFANLISAFSLVILGILVLQSNKKKPAI